MNEQKNVLADYFDDIKPDAEIAAALGISKRTLTRYEMQPDGLPCIKIGGKKYRRLSAVREWLERREQCAVPRNKVNDSEN